MLDVVPRMGLLRQAGVQHDTPVFVPARRAFQEEMLTTLGIRPDRIVDPATHPSVRAEHLYVPSVPCLGLDVPAWVVSYLRHLVPAEQGALPRERFYIGRDPIPHTRRLLNEDEVLSFLTPLGVKPLSLAGMTVAEQARRFASADLIIAPHGAALTNLAFCSPGATVIELFPADYVNVCYWALAAQVPGVRYSYVIGSGRPARESTRMWGTASDFSVEVRHLGALLAALNLS